MRASAEIEPKVPLANNNIWIIDDDIPIQSVDFDKDDMVSGERPIDRGTLLSLIGKEDEWTDSAVLELCKQLVACAGELKAFPSPPSAIKHLRSGAVAPDVVIFDLKYQTITNKDDVLGYLDVILNECISVVQIYTEEITRGS